MFPEVSFLHFRRWFMKKKMMNVAEVAAKNTLQLCRTICLIFFDISTPILSRTSRSTIRDSLHNFLSPYDSQSCQITTCWAHCRQMTKKLCLEFLNCRRQAIKSLNYVRLELFNLLRAEAIPQENEETFRNLINRSNTFAQSAKPLSRSLTSSTHAVWVNSSPEASLNANLDFWFLRR